MLFIEHVFIKVHYQSYMDIISLHCTCRAGGTKSGHSFIMAGGYNDALQRALFITQLFHALFHELDVIFSCPYTHNLEHK